jgi:hypothetical protein
MSTPIYTPLQAEDKLLSQELLSPFASRPVVAYQTKILRPELLSETAEITPSTSGIQKSATLISIVILASGFTIGSPAATSDIGSYYVRASSNPAELCAEIGEALQISPLHWAASTRQKINDYDKLLDNWDGEGAVRPAQQTVTAAKQIFETIVAFAVQHRIHSVPATVPLSDGAIRFEWAVGDREVFITVHGDTAEAQHWEPRDSIESIHYAQFDAAQVEPELEWLRA